jgi:hypothetical protein
MKLSAKYLSFIALIIAGMLSPNGILAASIHGIDGVPGVDYFNDMFII